MRDAMQPPDWAEALLLAILPADRAEAVSGDLLEVYRDEQLPARGRGGADRWYVRRWRARSSGRRGCGSCRSWPCSCSPIWPTCGAHRRLPASRSWVWRSSRGPRGGVDGGPGRWAVASSLAPARRLRFGSAWRSGGWPPGIRRVHPANRSVLDQRLALQRRAGRVLPALDLLGQRRRDRHERDRVQRRRRPDRPDRRVSQRDDPESHRADLKVRPTPVYSFCRCTCTVKAPPLSGK